MGKLKKSAKQKRVEAYIAASEKIELQTVIDPRLYRSLEQMLVQALISSQNDQILRDRIAAFSLEVRMQALARHQFITADSQALTELLRRTDPNRKPDKPKRFGDADVFEYLSKTLSGEQYSGVQLLREVWSCFGRFLTIASQGFEKGGGVRRAHVMQPLDVMPDDVWEDYKSVFKPWISAASRRTTPRMNHGNANNAEIVHRIVVEEYFPIQIDSQFGLRSGMALTTLRSELDLLYGKPEPISEGVRVYVNPSPAPIEAVAA